MIRTDLAKELINEHEKEILPEGVKKKVEIINGIDITQIEISNQSTARILNKPMGDYITIEPTKLSVVSENFDTLVEIVSQNILKLLPQGYKSVLVAGLGNIGITPDSLGPKSIQYTMATRHISGDLAKEIGLQGLGEVSVIATGVLAQTGIESANIIKALAQEIKADAVIIIDAMACKNLDRLGKTIQISNTGICPGSGVQNSRTQIDESFMGMSVISIGVPMVVDLHTIAKGYLHNENLPFYQNANMMVTPREIDDITEHASKLLGFAINKAMHPSLELEDIIALVN